MMRLTWAVLMAGFFFLPRAADSSWGWETGRKTAEVRMANSSTTGTQTIQESRDLMLEATRLARSNEPADHVSLLGKLQSEDFLKKLDGEKAYRGPARNLRLRPVLEALSKNPAPSARNALGTLIQTPSFYREPARADLLIKACAEVRPAPPEVIQFWDGHSQPDDGFTPLTIDALVCNGSETAIALLEKKMTDPRHGEEDKLDWMRSSILTHRNDLTLLHGCERMLAGNLSPKLKVSLVEVLFDYRPAEWYRPSGVLRPPDRRLASPPALAQLQRIGDYALRNLITLEADAWGFASIPDEKPAQIDIDPLEGARRMAFILARASTLMDAQPTVVH